MQVIEKEQRKWIVKKHNKALVYDFARKLDLEPVTAALLLSRGYDTLSKVYDFFYPSLESLHSPFLLKDIERAVARILQAIEKKEKILIWGNYDVDGITGTVVLRKAFRELGIETDYYIPHRLNEGYGLNLDALKRKTEEGVKVVITVDTGSLAFHAAEWAKDNNICLIVTDHHAIDKNKTKAYAMINPHQNDCFYPNKEIAGVGLAFKLVQALFMSKNVSDRLFIEELLELVAVGTIADIKKLTGENRSIVKFGLKRLKDTKNKGLKALIDVTGLSNKPQLGTCDVGFQIVHRLNAAGRLEHAKDAVDLLETDSTETVYHIATLLNEINRKRQVIQNHAVVEAFSAADALIDPYVIVLASENWHRGIVGLVASKVVERYNRPSFVISIKDRIGYGSARTINGFNLIEALDKASDVLVKYGGHKESAGFELHSSNIPIFSRILNQYASKVLTPESLTKYFIIDALLSFESINPKLWTELVNFEPFGIGNPKPVFFTKGVKILNKRLCNSRIKFSLVSERKTKMDGVFWIPNLSDEFERFFRLIQGQTIDVVYELESNVWNEGRNFQLKIKDFTSKMP